MSANIEALREKARLLRIHSLRATTKAGSGHPTSCLSAADLVAALFFLRDEIRCGEFAFGDD